jgi:hypothetical protein
MRKRHTTMPTTEETYHTDLTAAREMIEARVQVDGWPEGERETAIGDALNNAWVEGMTLTEWVDAAAVRIGFATR